MSRAAVLTVCLLAAVASAAAVEPASKCQTSSPAGRPMMAGGWKPTQTVPPAVFEAIGTEIVESGNSTWVPCDDPVPMLLEACSQVVAGQNYEVVAELSCPDTQSTVAFAAEVYVPLPVANAEPEVTSLQILAVDGTPLA